MYYLTATCHRARGSTRPGVAPAAGHPETRNHSTLVPCTMHGPSSHPSPATAAIRYLRNTRVYQPRLVFGLRTALAADAGAKCLTVDLCSMISHRLRHRTAIPRPIKIARMCGLHLHWRPRPSSLYSVYVCVCRFHLITVRLLSMEKHI